MLNDVAEPFVLIKPTSPLGLTNVKWVLVSVEEALDKIGVCEPADSSILILYNTNEAEIFNILLNGETTSISEIAIEYIGNPHRLELTSNKLNCMLDLQLIKQWKGSNLLFLTIGSSSWVPHHGNSVLNWHS